MQRDGPSSPCRRMVCGARRSVGYNNQLDGLGISRSVRKMVRDRKGVSRPTTGIIISGTSRLTKQSAMHLTASYLPKQFKLRVRNRVAMPRCSDYTRCKSARPASRRCDNTVPENSLAVVIVHYGNTSPPNRHRLDPQIDDNVLALSFVFSFRRLHFGRHYFLAVAIMRTVLDDKWCVFPGDGVRGARYRSDYKSISRGFCTRDCRMDINKFWAQINH